MIPYVIHLYFQYLKKHPIEMLLNTVFMILIPIQDVYLPHCYGKIISNISHGIFEVQPFVTVLCTMILLQLGFYLGDWHDSIVYPKLQEHMRGNILSKILKVYEQSYKELNSGEIISVLVKIPHIMCIWFERIKNNILPFFLTFIVSVFYFFSVDILLGVSLFLLGVLFLITMYLAPKGCSDTTKERDKTLNTIYEEIDDVLRNLFSIYGTDQKENEVERGKEFENLHRQLFNKTVMCIFTYKIWITPMIILFLCIFIFRCYELLKTKTMETKSFVPVFMILLYILNSIMYTNDQFRDIVFEWGVIKSTDAVINPETISKQSTIYTPQDIEYIRTTSSGIGLKDVTFKYPNTKQNIFTNLSLHIHDNEKVIITGDIGGGKSTLLKMFLKYHDPDQGFLYYDNQFYADIDIKTLRKRIGYVPQIPILFNRSVIQNIMYGNSNITREIVIDFLQKYDILKEFAVLENGIDTKIGKNGSHISGGQRQLVWCIRVILSSPDILILDEPTASIDLRTKEVLFRLLDDYMTNKTVVMVTHDDYLISKATRHIHMSKGLIVKDEKLI